MRYLVLIISMIAGPVMAAQDAAEGMCREMAETAEWIMQERQQGRPAPEMIDAVTTGDDVLDPVLEDLVLTAYDTSRRYHTERQQQREVERFSNRVYMECRREAGEMPDQEALR